MYGQSTRIFLNYDAIFLAELLTFLAEGKINYHQEWSPALLSYNCFRLPKDEAIPLSLRYAASVNVLFSGVKIRDNATDNKSFLWRQAGKLYDKKFTRAEEQLAAWGLDLDAVNAQLLSHAEREVAPATQQGLDYLYHLAEPTSTVTGMVFAQGAQAIGRPELKGHLRALGEDFGKLIYLLDAFTDFEKDQRKGHFNPIQKGWDLKAKEMPEEVREVVKGYLVQIAGMVETVLQDLPIAAAEKRWFTKRVRENLYQQIGLDPQADCGTACTSTTSKKKRKIPLRQRWQFLRNIEAAWANKGIRQRTSTIYTWLAFSMVAALALLFPSFLYAKADYFSSVDPDFLNRFGDLHPVWKPDPEMLKAQQCCNGGCDCQCEGCCEGCNGCCEGCNGCCDGCQGCCGEECGKCDNCCKNCNCKKNCKMSDGECTALIIGIGLLALAAWAFMAASAFFLLRWLLRTIFPDTFGRNNPPGTKGGPAKRAFRSSVQYEGISRTVLLSEAQTWFATHYPNATTQMDTRHPDQTTVYAHAEIPIRGRAKSGGPALDFGKVNFQVEITVEHGTAVLQFKDFHHHGSAHMPAGGFLGKPEPDAVRGNMTVAAWKMIKETTGKRVMEKVNGFPETFARS